MDTDRKPMIVIVMGVSGTGKTTVAKLMAEQLGCDFVDGDDLHPAENVAKMASGQPLTDDERLPWLRKIALWIRQKRDDERRPAVVVCSALKRAYRDILRCGDGDRVIFVHLVGTREQIAARLSARIGHFMPSTLLDTQIDALEPLGPDEGSSRMLVIDIGKPPQELVANIIEQLNLN